MALPVEIPGINLNSSVASFHGPFKAPNGAIYIFTNLSILKCSDFDFPTGAFSEQDASNAPSLLSAERPVWAYLSGSEIHVAHYYDDGTDIYWLYSSFNTATDTWTTTENTVETFDDKAQPLYPSCSMVFREDNGGYEDRIILYSGERDKASGTYYERVDYARSSNGTSWTAGISVDNSASVGGVNYWTGVAVRGSVPDTYGHVVHFWWHYDSGHAVRARTLRRTSSAWNLSSELSLGVTASFPQYHKFCNGISYDDAGTVHVAVGQRNNTELHLNRRQENSSGDLTTTGAAPAISDTGSPGNELYYSGIIFASLAIDPVRGKAYAVWTGGGSAGADRDMYRDEAASSWGSWGTDTEEQDAITLNEVYCNIYARNGQLRLGILYSTSTSYYYDEVDITKPTAPAFSAAEFPQQNYYIGPEKV
jgi:hypothetical protein